MMGELALWVYVLNAVLLLSHQVDAAFWNEWKLFFKKKEGIAGFLAFNFVAVLLALIGLVEVAREANLAFFFSIALALTGIGTFAIHAFFWSKGNKEFTTKVSAGILLATLVASIAQLAIALI